MKIIPIIQDIYNGKFIVTCFSISGLLFLIKVINSIQLNFLLLYFISSHFYNLVSTISNLFKSNLNDIQELILYCFHCKRKDFKK
jgi:hypothetical protein